MDSLKRMINGYQLLTFEKANRREFKTVPDGFLLSQRVVENAERIYNMEVRPDDVWVVTPPKCGTTWMQEIVWCIVNGMDIDAAKNCLQFYRFPFFNACFSSTFKTTTTPDGKVKCSIFGREVENYGTDINIVDKTPENLSFFLANSFEYTESLLSPRCIKSHLPLRILPQTLPHRCKIVYVARNIKDICVSTFHQKRAPATFEEHARAFKDGDVMIGNWFEHMKQAWDLRNHPNVKFAWYEDMKNNIGQVINEIASFLSVELKDDDLEKLMEYVNIENFRKNKMVNKYYEMGGKEDFMRKGIVGDWKNYFDDNLNAEWNLWIAAELKRTGLPMKGWK